MRVSKDELPVSAQTEDYALVKIFPDHACPVEHWGFIFRGQVRVEYTDGQEEILSAGDAFYIPRGHRPYMLAETELLQLTRKSEHNELVRKFAAAGLLPSE